MTTMTTTGRSSIVCVLEYTQKFFSIVVSFTQRNYVLFFFFFFTFTLKRIFFLLLLSHSEKFKYLYFPSKPFLSEAIHYFPPFLLLLLSILVLILPRNRLESSHEA